MPRWVQIPEDITASIGETVLIKCVASGSPKPKISWKKYSGEIPVFYLFLI